MLMGLLEAALGHLGHSQEAAQPGQMLHARRRQVLNPNDLFQQPRQSGQERGVPDEPRHLTFQKPSQDVLAERVQKSHLARVKLRPGLWTESRKQKGRRFPGATLGGEFLQLLDVTRPSPCHSLRPA